MLLFWSGKEKSLPPLLLWKRKDYRNGKKQKLKKFMTTTFRKQEKMMKPDKNTTENSGNAKNSAAGVR